VAIYLESRDFSAMSLMCSKTRSAFFIITSILQSKASNQGISSEGRDCGTIGFGTAFTGYETEMGSIDSIQ